VDICAIGNQQSRDILSAFLRRFVEWRLMEHIALCVNLSAVSEQSPGTLDIACSGCFVQGRNVPLWLLIAPGDKEHQRQKAAK
jgi:hypothetical protein